MQGLRVGVFVLGGAVGALGCPSVSPFVCGSSGQCVREGTVGVCQPDTARCAYEDPRCATGFRYPESTDLGLAGTCVDASSAATTGSPSTGTPDPIDTTDPLASSTSSTSASEADTTSDETTTGAPTCTLEVSAPIAHADAPGIDVGAHVIDATDVPAVRIENSPDARLHDLELTYSGTTAVVVLDSPRTHIERLRIRNVGIQGPGPAAASEFAIRVERSNDVVIEDVYVEDARTGVAVLDTDGVTIERVWVVNARGDVNTDGRGEDDGGDGILLQSCTAATIRDFGCTNTPDAFQAHAGIFIDRCFDVLVEGGIADEITQQSAAGIRIHTTTRESGSITVRDFDVVGGRHACFDTLVGRDVTFENTGCRNQPDIGWKGSFDIEGPMRVLGGRYYDVAQTSCCDGDYVEFEASEDQFVPRLPPATQAPCTHVGG